MTKKVKTEQPKTSETSSKINELQELYKKALEGKFVRFSAEDTREMNRLFVEVYRKPMCPTCSGDVMIALDLYIKYLMKQTQTP